MAEGALLEELTARVRAELSTASSEDAGTDEARTRVREVARWILDVDHPDLGDTEREVLVEGVVDALIGSGLGHLDTAGHVRMVDVSSKEPTDREAIAQGLVRLDPEARRRLFAGELPKGDALASVRLAGIMGAKQTAFLVPLCHPLPLTGVEVQVDEVDTGARITARVRTHASTGVEMEAMTAVAVAALALYDMIKGIDRGAEIEGIRLLHKRGGRSGAWYRAGTEDPEQRSPGVGPPSTG
ncbi:MAG: cyclic pyranopterin monophosphate synthase MoaC [Acidimicrobiia bacterium]